MGRDSVLYAVLHLTQRETQPFIHSFVSCIRPCAMVVPDTELICEIMLVAEGFRSAKHLAKKFITLYSLCKEQLSQQVNDASCRAAAMFKNM